MKLSSAPPILKHGTPWVLKGPKNDGFYRVKVVFDRFLYFCSLQEIVVLCCWGNPKVQSRYLESAGI